MRLSPVFAGISHREEGNRVSENGTQEEENGTIGVETQWGSVVGCNICGWFFPEWDE